MAELLLSVRGVAVSVSGHQINAPISFTVSKGDMLQILGGNGSGKTTLIRAILGVHREFTGSIHRHTRETMSYVPQGANDFATVSLTSLHSLLPEPSDAARVIDAILGIHSFERHPLRVLSGGQRQRAMLSLALRKPHNVLLLDEPFAAIDNESMDHIASALGHLQTTRGILLVEHRVHRALPVTARIRLDSRVGRQTPASAMHIGPAQL